MFLSLFCKICELNTEREIVFVLISVDCQGTGVISGSQMGLQLVQNTEIIKQLTYYFGKSEENMDLSRIYLALFT